MLGNEGGTVVRSTHLLHRHMAHIHACKTLTHITYKLTKIKTECCVSQPVSRPPCPSHTAQFTKQLHIQWPFISSLVLVVPPRTDLGSVYSLADLIK